MTDNTRNTMPSKRQLVLFVLTPWLMASAPLQAGVLLTYRTVSGNSHSISTCEIQNFQDSVKFTLEWSTGKQRLRSEVTTDSTLSATQWKYSNKVEGSEVFAVRKKDTLFLSGIFKKKPVTKKFAVGNMLWKEVFPYDLSNFATGKENQLKFFGIGLEEPSAMRIGTFNATKTGIETINVNGQNIETIHIRVALTGMGAYLWRGDYWLRKSDGCAVRVKSMTKGSTPIVSDLISEK
jgi:hypothetical protein